MTQQQIIKKHLLKKKSITMWDAITKYKITRLASVIYYIRKQGWIINKTIIGEGLNKYSKYTLVKSK